MTTSTLPENRMVFWLSRILPLLGVAMLYALLAKVVLTFFAEHGVISVVWPPSGLALAALLLGGKRYAVGVFLGAFLANAMTGLPWGIAAAIATGNTLEALLGAWLLTRDGKFDPNFRSLRDYLRLIVLAGFLSVSVSALTGSATLLFSGFLASDVYFPNLLHWWMGDAIGILLITPVILAWRRVPKGWNEPKRVIEAMLVLGLAFLVGQVVFVGWFHDTLGLVARGYWMYLFVTWAAVRLETHGVVVVVIMTATQALVGAVHGIGFFADDMAQTQLANYWLYMVILSITGMALATYFNERKAITENLALFKRQNDLILNAAGEGICGLDTHGTIVFANPATARMLGYSVTELFGRSLHETSHHHRPDGSPYPAAECPILATLDSDHACQEGDEFYYRRDGSRFPVEYTSTPIIDEGNTIGAVVMFSDITRRRQAEASLCESEERFRTLFDGIADGIFVHLVEDNSLGHFVVVNDVACERLGYTRQEMLTMTPLDIDAPDTGIDIAPIIKRIEAGENVTFEQVHVAKDGRRIPVELRVNPILLQGQRAVMTLARDISERKQAEEMLRWSEERFRSTFEQAAVGVAHVATNGTFLRLNQKFCEIAGYPHAELMGLTFQDITFPDDLEKDLGYVQQALAGETATYTMEKRYVRKDQTRVWVNLTVSLVRKADGAPDYFISVIEDITERKRMEQQLRELSVHLQTVREEEKTSIAREIHDDLGSTLTALKMDVYWLARLLPAEKESVPLLERVESLSGLLDDAVAVTRRIISDLRPVVLDDFGLLAALEWQCAQFGKRTGIACRVHGIKDDSMQGELDSKQAINLFRVFQEALTNVSRHSGASRVEVEFFQGEDEILLSISDNGLGLPADRAIPSTSYGMRGMLERVEYLGGTIKFDSTPGGGTTVTVKLPPPAPVAR